MITRTDSLEIFKQNEYEPTEIGLVSNNAYLSIVATNNCQRSCPYCINSNTDRHLDLPTYKAVTNIKKLIETYGIKEAVILGGEPLLHREIEDLCREVKAAGIKRLYLTTNGIRLTEEEDLIYSLAPHLDGINISYHHNTNFIYLDELKSIYEKFFGCGVKVRVNTNVWRGNHDTFESLLGFVRLLTERKVCDEIRISNLIFKDSFSVNNINHPRTKEMILSDLEYKSLFSQFIAHEMEKYTVFMNPETLGFVRYYLIPSPTPVIINWNMGSKVSEQVCENDMKERKINTFKCLVSGDISLSWNTNNIIEL